ncbi:MAG: AbrB/MazE/SpoVT family DNA-binding domain-containing protein [Candidatus Woesearchaeota archaeon]|nr:AbrB/MazE/SpoVT family DNA-binding domain-containing protein [Candidatus Woesearchaeota archaeon]
MVGITTERKIGPKGQVVIPKIFRNAMNINPGETIQFHMEENTLSISKEQQNIIEFMEQTATNNAHVNSDKDYEAMMEERWKKST